MRPKFCAILWCFCSNFSRDFCFCFSSPIFFLFHFYMSMASLFVCLPIYHVYRYRRRKIIIYLHQNALKLRSSIFFIRLNGIELSVQHECSTSTVNRQSGVHTFHMFRDKLCFYFHSTLYLANQGWSSGLEFDFWTSAPSL